MRDVVIIERSGLASQAEGSSGRETQCRLLKHQRFKRTLGNRGVLSWELLERESRL